LILAADKQIMKHILILQNGGELSGVLGPESGAQCVAILDEARREIAAHPFEAAVVDAKDGAAAKEALRVLRELDPDLAVLLVAGADSAAPENGCGQAWETVPRPINVALLKLAIQRARRLTLALRENRALRGRVGQPQGAGPPPPNGGFVGLHWIEDLPPRLDLRDLLSTVEKSVIQRTLAATRGAQAEAARRLGLSRSDLSYKLAKYELRKPAERVS
jgi:DNA-binding NtrC family response regulator